MLDFDQKLVPNVSMNISQKLIHLSLELKHQIKLSQTGFSRSRTISIFYILHYDLLFNIYY